DVIAVLPGGSVVSVQQRTTDNQWIGVVTQDGIMGWVKASDVFALVSLTILPAVGAPTQIVAVPTTAVLPATSEPTIEPSLMPEPTAVTLGDVPAMEQRLRETPIFQNLVNERLQAIFETGQGDGNRANVFTTVGDSNTVNGDFMQPIGMGADTYCTWGSYNYLHATVDYFSAPPTSTDSNSFVHHSIAAGRGFSTASVLDPLWANDAICGSDNSPLTCEIEQVRPSVAVIMLGNIDVSDMGTADYDANMRLLVRTLIQNGVIPVLTTFVVVPDRDVYERSLEFNMTLLDIAQQEQIPLINLWAAAQTLPQDGIGPDGTHLKAVVGSFCSFDGAQMQDGGTLRNLLTLQALDQLRQNVLTK
ncbi:MAG TPA: SGNH/GDSL hydrolase family protein, partial [Phototrophicaceae bacterium]|nr:SGNH/GDSL hydrolase family protein [Phototrophicaceae bacterium]